MASINQALLATEAKRLNTVNMTIKSELEELFDLPVFMNVAAESEIPENLTYFIIETDDYTKTHAGKGLIENFTISMWSTNREDPTLDHLMTVAVGLDHRYNLINTTNDYIIMEKTNEIVNLFTANFTRSVKVGC